MLITQLVIADIMIKSFFFYILELSVEINIAHDVNICTIIAHNLFTRSGTQTGTYIYIETSDPQQPGDKAAILSPRIQKTSSRCFMSFWYHMTGSHIGSLEVRIKSIHCHSNHGLGNFYE